MSQVKADFSVDTISGCSPLFVKFTDKSTGNPTSWFWDLGNGNTSTLKNPSTFYFNPGSYTVKLVVKNANSADSIIKTQLITVYAVPAVNFVPSDTTGCFPLKVQFTNLSTAGSGTIDSYQWNFGDGNSSTLANPAHIYNAPGNYSVSLKVTNSNGCSKLITKSGLIKIQTGVKASFTVTPFTDCRAPITVSFINTSLVFGTVSYFWDFGDGSTSTQANPLHTYTVNGIYNVKLVVKNLAGCTDSIVKINAILVGSNKALISSPDTVCVNSAVQFTNASTPSAGDSYWDFGDGSSSLLKNPIKTFSNTGTYFVKLVNLIGTCSDSVLKKITVVASPNSNFSEILPASMCQLPAVVNFQNQSAGAASYLWNFGDGATSTQQNPSHTYTSFGSYTVSLLVKSNFGCTDTLIKPNLVFIGPPVIDSISGANYKGCLPYVANLSAIVKTNEAIASYFWNFGDGTTSTLPNPVHAYNVEGSFTITLIIKTVSGCSDTLIVPNAIIVNKKPVPNFGASPLLTCAENNVYFIDSSLGTITDYFWKFGDGGTSTDKNPIYQYSDTGYFTVTLFVKNNFCIDSFTRTNYIYILPPISKFKTIIDCDYPYFRQFIDTSIAPQRWEWDFGDGNTSTLQHPSHIYSSPGKYLVTLTVYNQSCKHLSSDSIMIIDEHPILIASDTSVCKYADVLFTTTNINPANIKSYDWDFGDGKTFISTSPSVKYAYKTRGKYFVRVITTDLLGCKDTSTFGPVRVVAPIADFGQPPGTCINNNLFFNGKSLPDTGYPIVKWIWNFGDGTIDSNQVNVFSHTYSQAGLFDISLIVKDSKGCSDTLSKQQVVLITDPKAAFYIKDSVRCSDNLVSITNTSTGFGLSYLWDLGDGTFSTIKDPVHIYSNEANYPISLTVTDTFGCTHTLNKPFAVKVGNAKASFNVSDSIQLCPPFIAQFTNTSKDFSSVAWDFDDGGFSNLLNPSYVFNSPGTYNIKLTAYGFGNCIDTAFKKVVVKGPTGKFTYGPKVICAGMPVDFVATTKNNASFIWDFGDGNTLSTTDSVVSHKYLNPGKFVPKMVLVDAGGCKVPIIGEDTVLVMLVKAVPTSIKSSFCDSGRVQFWDSSYAILDGISSYLWNFGDGNFSSLENPVHTFATYGTFNVKLSVTSINGCFDSAYVYPQITITPTPKVLIAGDTVICINSQANFSASLAVPNNYIRDWSWNFGNGKTENVQNPTPQNYLFPGVFKVTVKATTIAGCIDSASLNIKVNGLPEVNAGNDTIVCLGRSIRLNVVGTALNYLWQPNATLSCLPCNNPLATPRDSSVRYIVSGTDNNGCIAFDTVAVRVVFPFRLKAGIKDTICVGESVQLFANGTNNYSWSPVTGLNNPDIANPIAKPLVTTNYKVVGTDNYGCFSDSVFVPITVYPIPVFNIIPDTLHLSVGNSVQIKTSNSPDIKYWRWIPTTGLDCYNCPQPIASPKNTTTYKAIAWNDGGCKVEDVVEVIVTCTGGNIFIPNSFSPNNDGVNDIFYPRGKGIGSIKSFRIFNRWGMLVFEKYNFSINDPKSGWDGTHNGQKQSSDVYVYDIQVVCDNSQIFYYKGNISLLN